MTALSNNLARNTALLTVSSVAMRLLGMAWQVWLAGRIGALSVQGVSEIVFVIGGADGMGEDVKAACDFRLSFSRMTFPHTMMRVILAEQLYRALTILNHGNYHK